MSAEQYVLFSVEACKQWDIQNIKEDITTPYREKLTDIVCIHLSIINKYIKQHAAVSLLAMARMIILSIKQIIIGQKGDNIFV